jgi:hypothetical protein
VPEGDVKECFEKLLGLLDFLRTEFLRVISEHGLRREDITTALAGLAVGASDSLSAAILALSNYDPSCNGVMVRRFEEHFALMFYFACCDDGGMLSRWFKNPRMVLTERNHKIRTAVDAKMANFFKRNPDWSFKDRFRTESAESVHATWASVTHSIAWASGRYGLQTPEAHSLSSLADELRRGQAVLALATLGPSVSRFIEFLQKFVFTRPEFAQVSPGNAYLSELDKEIVQWWGTAGKILSEVECGNSETLDAMTARSSGPNKQQTSAPGSEAPPEKGEAEVFESEIHRLDWLIQQIEERVTQESLPPVDAELLVLFSVTGAWFNTALTRTRAILMLLEHGLQEAAGPLQRALWELWTDWHYLLKHGDRIRNALKVRLNAMVEAVESLDNQQHKLPPPMLVQMKQDVQEFEAQYPDVSAEVRAQRKKRKFHWSGLIRSERERTFSGGTFVYQYLSWEAHGIMNPIRDVSWDFNDEIARFRFGRRETESEIDQVACMSGGVLFYIYNDFAQLWGLLPVVLPDAKATDTGG